jgi:hypothetical protein
MCSHLSSVSPFRLRDIVCDSWRTFASTHVPSRGKHIFSLLVQWLTSNRHVLYPRVRCLGVVYFERDVGNLWESSLKRRVVAYAVLQCAEDCLAGDLEHNNWVFEREAVHNVSQLEYARWVDLVSKGRVIMSVLLDGVKSQGKTYPLIVPAAMIQQSAE